MVPPAADRPMPASPTISQVAEKRRLVVVTADPGWLGRPYLLRGLAVAPCRAGRHSGIDGLRDGLWTALLGRLQTKPVCRAEDPGNSPAGT